MCPQVECMLAKRDEVEDELSQLQRHPHNVKSKASTKNLFLLPLIWLKVSSQARDQPLPSVDVGRDWSCH